MTVKDFTNDLAAVVLPGVRTVYPDIPKELYARELPAQWVDMPSINVNPEESGGTFEESGVRYTVRLFIAAFEVTEGLPAEHRDGMLDLAAAVELWAKGTPYIVEIATAARLPVGGREYRGVVATVTAIALQE